MALFIWKYEEKVSERVVLKERLFLLLGFVLYIYRNYTKGEGSI